MNNRMWNESRTRPLLAWGALTATMLGLIYVIPDPHRHRPEQAQSRLESSTTRPAEGLVLNGVEIPYKANPTLDLDALLREETNTLLFARAPAHQANRIEIEYTRGHVRAYDFRGEETQRWESTFAGLPIEKITITVGEQTYVVRDDGK